MFKKELEKLGFSINDKQEEQFKKYFEFLVEYNKITNLTAITEKSEVYYKHFFDSLLLSQTINLKDQSICDMGAGAGFPSIPLKIMFPRLKITIVDSLNKRIKFLEELVKLLELEDVNLVHDRAENYSLSNKGKFDLVTCRALGHLNLILELGFCMLKINGEFIALKGNNFLEELEESKNCIKTLKYEYVKVDEYELPDQYGFRSILVFKKTKDIKGYPREFKIISKSRL